MDKYDIGVLGLWPGCNYGSVATYYALYCVLTSMGKTVLMIDKPILVGDDAERDMTHSRRFANEHYNISEQYKLDELYKLNDLCDSFVIGSDQVWNYGISRNFGKAFYFDFANEDKKKIAYAVSFGHEVDFAPPVERAVITEYMKKIDGISVREDDGVRLCRDAYGIKAEHVLDPVFLAEPEVYTPLIEKSSANETEPFLLAYILDPTPEKRKAVLHLSKKLGGIKIINLLDGLPWDFEKNKKLIDLPNCIENLQVEDWLYYLKNAKYVITDSCHGASFAIIFNKNLVGITNKRRGFSRFKSLFSLLEIETHLVTDPKLIIDNENILKPIDYKNVNSIISKERKRCYDWLYKVLAEPKQTTEILRQRNTIETNNKNDIRKIHEKSVEGANLNCTGCSACAMVCPKSAIEMKENSEGFLNPVVDYDKCVDCGICVKKCVDINPQYKNNENPKCYAMMASDEIRKTSSSGGMFTVAAEYILDNGGYVCGAAYRDDFTVEHIIISDKKDLAKLRGSKYMQSHMNNVYADVKKLLEDNKLVLFTAMPCQVAGLYSYLGKDYDTLYTIDLLCHGITSSKVFEKYHKEVLDGKKLKRLEFKEKEPWGWHAGVNAYFEDGTKYSKPLETDMYFIAYLQSIAKNTTCEVCKLNRLPRQADLTMGDFWGIAQNDPQAYDEKGTSVVLANNDKGIEFFKKLEPLMKFSKEEPLQMAIQGNYIIKAPYKLHKNRQAFFDNFDKLDFASLTLGCFGNKLYKYQEAELLKTLPESKHELYYLAKTTAENCKGRKIVAWMNDPVFEKILKDYFNLDVEFSVTKYPEKADGKTIADLSVLDGQKDNYYVVVLHGKYYEHDDSLLIHKGYREIEDFVFRNHKPVVLENYDCSKGRYSDEYGNTIDGWNAVIGKVVFKGGNNHITLGKYIRNAQNLTFELNSNATVDIGDNVRFNGETKIEVRRYDGYSKLNIKNNIRFDDAYIVFYGSQYISSISIDDNCTFESNLEIHANSGKKIIIGRDCMFSHGINLWAGDGHTIFDIHTGENINTDYPNLPDYKNNLIIGEHVWVGKGAMIMHGTNIGNGSIVGAMSVIKGKYPNNCSIAGNPSAIVKRNIAWSRDMYTTDMMARCGGEQYVRLTENLNSKPADESKQPIANEITQPTTHKMSQPIANEKSGQIGFNLRVSRVIVTGGGSGIGLAITKKLIENGCKVCITGRSIEKLKKAAREINSENLSILQFDVKDIESIIPKLNEAAVLLGGYYDGVVNSAGVNTNIDNWNISEHEWDNIMDTDLKASVFLMRKAVVCMKDNNIKGNFLQISSVCGSHGTGGSNAYCIAKDAVTNATRQMAKQSAHLGIVINGIAPGTTYSPMNPNRDVHKQQAIGRIIEPEEIADIAMFMLSDAAKICIGETILADGGFWGYGAW